MSDPQDTRPDARSATIPIEPTVDELFEGTADQPGLKMLELAPLIGMDRNGDGRLNAADVDPDDEETAFAAQYDIDLGALERGMRERLGSLAHRFDANGDGKFDAPELQGFLTQVLKSAQEDVSLPEQDQPYTTQQVLDGYEQAINHGLPAMPPKSDRQR